VLENALPTSNVTLPQNEPFLTVQPAVAGETFPQACAWGYHLPPTTRAGERAICKYQYARNTPDFLEIRSVFKFVDRLRRAYKAGVTVVFGTDLMVSIPGQTRGEAALDYIDSFVEAGVPAPAIVRAMTSDAARLLGVDEERGTLKPGMAADIDRGYGL
jgi:hypothetical protein